MTTYQAADSYSSSHSLPISNEEPQENINLSVPFCGRRFKVLRVVAYTLTSLIMALAYKILSIACWITFQSGKARIYSDLSLYHYSRGYNRLKNYFHYGNKIINFSINSTGINKEPADENLNKKEVLKEFYGEKFDEMLSCYPPCNHPLDESLLNFQPILKGICAGVSIDFVSRYFHSGQTVEEISQHFENGGTKEGQLTQIIYNSQSGELIDDRITEYKNKAKIKLKKNQAERQRLEEKIIALDYMPIVAKELRREVKQLRLEACKIEEKLLEFSANIVFETLKPLGIMNRVELNSEKIFFYDSLSQDYEPSDLLEYAKSLPFGVYLTSFLKSGSDIGHLAVFIKSSNGDRFIFEPNFATLKIDDDTESSSILAEILKFFAKKVSTTEKKCAIHFYSCHPAA